MKKISSLVLAFALVLALSVSAFAVAYDFEDGVIPAEWEQHWGGKNFSIVDGALFVDRLADQNSMYSTGFEVGELKAGVTYSVKADVWFDDADYGSTVLFIGLVDGGESTVLLQEEHCRGTSQHIESFQLTLISEESKHFRSFDLVEMRGILLNGDESIGHKTGLLHRAAFYNKGNTVSRILAGHFLPDNRFLEKAGQ